MAVVEVLRPPRARSDDTPPALGCGWPAPYLRWRVEWDLGVDFMDDDHRALAALLDDLAHRHGPPHLGTGRDLGSAAAPAGTLIADLARLAEHTRAHFEREEQAMRAADFPGLPEHKSEHDQLLAELAVIHRQTTAGALERLDTETLLGLKDWLLGHLLELDRELAEFLRTAG